MPRIARIARYEGFHLQERGTNEEVTRVESFRMLADCLDVHRATRQSYNKESPGQSSAEIEQFQHVRQLGTTLIKGLFFWEESILPTVRAELR